jgi:hypothetical protein
MSKVGVKVGMLGRAVGGKCAIDLGMGEGEGRWVIPLIGEGLSVTVANFAAVFSSGWDEQANSRIQIKLIKWIDLRIGAIFQVQDLFSIFYNYFIFIQPVLTSIVSPKVIIESDADFDGIFNFGMLYNYGLKIR